MAGSVLLAGGAEFGGRMAEVDRLALARAGGAGAAVRIVPAAAAPDQNDGRVGRAAASWFRGLGASDVAVVAAVDRAAADDARLAGELRVAGLVYLPGGFPHYLGQTLAGTRCAAAMREAYAAGGVVGGSSAGAMVMCEWYWDPARRSVERGLGLVPGACVMPHHETYGASWLPALRAALPGAALVGVDERTGLLGEPGGEWEVAGQGAVTLYLPGQTLAYRAGDRLKLG